MTRILWHIRQTISRLWFRASVFGVGAVITALLAYSFRNAIPEDISQKIGADAVDSLLNIIATTMLAVTTFSLSTMVAAYSAATNNVTPRSTKLLLQDRTSQNALATFIGAFIFSLVGIIALKIGIYGSSGRLILFVVTITVIVFIIVTLIRWIEHLSLLGRVGETINRVEDATKRATLNRIKNPYLGGVSYDPDHVPRDAAPFFIAQIGYVQVIDMDQLSDIATKAGGKVFIRSLPGAFNTPDKPVAFFQGVDLEKFGDKIKNSFVIDDDRSFEQDPRFGMIVLSEIASRALSPAINDPGTAIDVIGTAVRILSLWQTEKKEDREPAYKNIFVPPVRYADLFDDVFLPIARDGAGLREISLRLQKALISLATLGDAEFAQAAHDTSRHALHYAVKGLTLSRDYEEVEKVSLAARSGR